MPDSTLTSKQVTDEIRRLATLTPNHIYIPQYEGSHTCFYVHETNDLAAPRTPGCIIGHGLHNLGIPLETLSKFDPVETDALPAETDWGDTYPASALLTHFVPDSSSSDIVWVDRVQECQDDSAPWSEAVKSADIDYEYRKQTGKTATNVI